jgi:D-alanyl-lipoteichoic acid acyltransferase DltB (MBOAT superfamily)
LNLLIASYLFYSAWNPPFVLLIVVSTLVDWFAGRNIHARSESSWRSIFLAVSLCVNLGMLSFFKYSAFLLDNVVRLLAVIQIQFKPASLDLLLPLGISFFTFQSLTYTIDIYRRKAKPWESFLDYALYVSFFPKVVIGPITRAFDFLPQCKNPPKVDTSKMAWGFFLLLWGIFEKNVMADRLLAPVADQLFDKVGVPDTISAWTGALAFTGQIFFDFAGYSCCAIGAALCLGFQLPDNFRFPYAALGFSDFWRRWHVSLSEWLRDYLYISLGGNRKGTIRTYANLMVTMLIGGLWHGASWTFIFWGGLHGCYLVLERAIKSVFPSSIISSKFFFKIGYSLVTFLLVCIAWVFFRSKSFETAFTIIKAMFAAVPTVVPSVRIESTTDILITCLIISLIFLLHWIMRNRSFEEVIDTAPWWMKSAVITGCLIAIFTFSGEDRAFIYFQF